MKPSNRYLKILVNNPYGTSLKKDQYIWIDKNGDCESKQYLFPDIDNLKEHGFELMPENFDPNNINKELEIEIW